MYYFTCGKETEKKKLVFHVPALYCSGETFSTFRLDALLNVATKRYRYDYFRGCNLYINKEVFGENGCKCISMAYERTRRCRKFEEQKRGRRTSEI